MDEARRLKVKHLAQCTFRPGSYEKRFVRDMAGRPDAELSIRQAHYIDLLYWMYRKQIAAMAGNDKPEVYRPGELMVDRAVESEKPPKVDRRIARMEERQLKAYDKMHAWNAKARKFNRDGEA